MFSLLKLHSRLISRAFVDMNDDKSLVITMHLVLFRNDEISPHFSRYLTN